GGPGGVRSWRGGPAAIGGDLSRQAIFLVVAQLVGCVDRCERTVIGDGEPDFDGRLCARGRNPCQQSADGCEMRHEPAEAKLRHLCLPLLCGVRASMPRIRSKVASL